ncbi:MAG: hypothetical protein AABX17_02345 [Nanoarchaeota archaeon]
MSKKKVLLVLGSFLIFSLFLIAFISAADDNSTNITATTKGTTAAAYSCLETQVNEKIDETKTTEELAFSLLALGYNADIQSKLVVKLEDLKSEDAECWPSVSGGTCTLKDTAQVLLAYDHIGKDTKEIKNWLKNQTMAPTDLTWYIQIETENSSKCTIKYDGTTKSINIDESKMISGSAGSCLRASTNGWLEVDSGCYGKTFDISCDVDFLVASTYKRKSSSTTSPTYYLTSSTQSQAQNGLVSTVINSVCFKQGSSCNYEGSLWAALAVDKGELSFKDGILPYLITLAADNEKYLPASFLYTLTDYNEYLTELANLQSRQGYWKISDTSRLYYDTAVALMKLGTSSSEQATNAKNYLLQASVQTSEGCWNGNNIRDTAFLLYSLDPKIARITTGAKTCADYSASGYSCITSTACGNINGTQQPYSCSSFGTICCSKSSVQTESCSAKGGTTCSSDERCTGELTSALGTTSCCLDGRCEQTSDGGDLSICEQQGYSCMIQCDNTQQEEPFTCSVESGGVCCSPKPQQSGSSSWWIWLLVILIILLVLAIIYRDQVKMWWFKFTNKFKKSSAPMQPPRPMAPGARPMMPFQPGRIVPGMMPPRGPMPPQNRFQPRPFPKEKELDDTLKKLREMGKK